MNTDVEGKDGSHSVEAYVVSLNDIHRVAGDTSIGETVKSKGSSSVCAGVTATVTVRRMGIKPPAPSVFDLGRELGMFLGLGVDGPLQVTAHLPLHLIGPA